VSFHGLILFASICLVLYMVLVSILVRCHGSRTIRRLSGW
jgi:hypothetical protein